MQDFKKGDRVSVLHDTISGVVVELEKDYVLIEDDDGFSRKYEAGELVLQQSGSAYRIESGIEEKDLVSADNRATKIIKTPEFDRSEIDLHIESLRDCHHGLSNHEIVQAQMNACRSFIKESIEVQRKKVVLIHGKGEGVLKSEIHRYLNKLAKEQGISLIYHDASFREYGIGGATEVVFNT